MEPAREVIAHRVLSPLVGDLTLEGLLTGSKGRGPCKQTVHECGGPAGTLRSLGVTKSTLVAFEYVSRQLELTVLGTHISPALCICRIISYMHFISPYSPESRIPVSPEHH